METTPRFIVRIVLRSRGSSRMSAESEHDPCAVFLACTVNDSHTYISHRYLATDCGEPRLWFIRHSPLTTEPVLPAGVPTIAFRKPMKSDYAFLHKSCEALRCLYLHWLFVMLRIVKSLFSYTSLAKLCEALRLSLPLFSTVGERKASTCNAFLQKSCEASLRLSLSLLMLLEHLRWREHSHQSLRLQKKSLFSKTDDSWTECEVRSVRPSWSEPAKHGETGRRSQKPGQINRFSCAVMLFVRLLTHCLCCMSASVPIVAFHKPTKSDDSGLAELFASAPNRRSTWHPLIPDSQAS